MIEGLALLLEHSGMKGIEGENQHLTNTMFADDTVIFALSRRVSQCRNLLLAGLVARPTTPDLYNA